MKHNYWNFFYKNKNINNKLNFPSQFSIFTLSKDVEKNILIELGCGNGRDAFYMAKYYNKIIAIDSSKIAIKDNIKKFKNIKNLVFLRENLTRKITLEIPNKEKKTVYARFFFHTLKNKEILAMVNILSSLLNKNEKVFLEYRTHLDKKTKKIFKKHFRNYIDPKKMVKIFKKENFINIYSNSSYGYALFGNEDPHIARQIFIKK